MWPTQCINDLTSYVSHLIKYLVMERRFGQECIPVGCVPAATVAVCWEGVCLSAFWDTPRCGPGHPLSGVGLETSQVWAWRPPGQIPQLPPWVWAWRPASHAGIPPIPLETCKTCWDTSCNACWDPPVDRTTDRCKNIILPQISFAGGNELLKVVSECLYVFPLTQC